MTPSPLETVPRDRLRALVEAYELKPQRQYRTFTRRQQTDILAAEIERALAAEPFGRWLARDGEEAAVVGRALPWDSEFFGVAMGRIDYVLATAGAAADLVRTALAASLDAARSRGLKHLAARVDVADLRTVGILESLGFRLMDTLVTYLMRPRKDANFDMRKVGSVRDVRPEDEATLVEITADAFRGYQSRFHLDPHLSNARADEFYLEWARQSVRKRMADEVLVAEDPSGGAIGYLAYRIRRPAGSASLPVFGSGIGACRPDALGAYTGLLLAATIRARDLGAIGECQTHNYNFPVIRVYEAAGLHYVRAEYTLHAWLD